MASVEPQEWGIQASAEHPLGGPLGRRAVLAVVLVVVVVTFIAFIPVLSNDFVNWDDQDNFIENPHYRGLGPDKLKWMFTAFHMGHYQPLSWLTLALDYELWGMNARGYHLTSLVIHCLGAVLFFFLGRRLMAAAVRRPDGLSDKWVIVGAGLAALLFAVHPMRVESVAWVTERRDVLNAFLALAGLLCYVKACRPGSAAVTGPRWMLLAVAFHAASLLAKSMTMTLPLLLVLLDMYPLRRLEVWSKRGLREYAKRCLPEKIPFVALSAGAAIAAFFVQREALIPFEQYGLLRRLAVVAYGVVFYVRESLLPINLQPLHELDFGFNPFEAKYIASALVALGLTGAVVALRKRRPSLLVAWTAYLVMLAPVSGISQNGPQLVADRYSYLACMPFALLAGGAVLALSRDRERERAFLLRVVTAACLAAVVVMGVITWRQNLVWRNSYALWQRTLSMDPNCSIARLNLGWCLLEDGRTEEAIAELQTALERRPRDAKVYNNLGRAHLQKGDVDRATAYLTEAVRIEPDYAEAHNNLGKALLEDGDIEGAIARFGKALACKEGFATARYNLGSAFLRKGDTEEAVRTFQEVLRTDPEREDVRVNLAAAHMAAGNLEAAFAQYVRVLEANPEEPESLYNLGNIHRKRGKVEEAVECYRESIRLRPDFSKAHYNLGNLFAARGEHGKAIDALEKAVRLDPSFVGGHINLAAAYLASKNPAAAIAQYEAAIKINPDLATAHYNLGSTYLMTNRIEEAIKSFGEALRLDPDDGDTHFRLAVALYHHKEYDRSREHVRRAQALGAKVNPRFLDALEKAGPSSGGQ